MRLYAACYRSILSGHINRLGPNIENECWPKGTKGKERKADGIGRLRLDLLYTEPLRSLAKIHLRRTIFPVYFRTYIPPPLLRLPVRTYINCLPPLHSLPFGIAARRAEDFLYVTSIHIHQIKQPP